MPYLKFNTNLEIPAAKAASIAREFSSLLVRETSKPERYVMVEVAAGKAMIFGGNDQPLAYLECKSIGMTSLQVKALAASLPDLLHRQLSIPADRVYIEFSNCSAECWGWNGSTFA